jgi:hypothetical protein
MHGAFWGAVMLGADALGLIDKRTRPQSMADGSVFVMGVVFPLLWADKMIRR